MTTTTSSLDMAAGFLRERADFLHVYAVKSPGGSGWDVVLRIDGTYANRPDAEAAAEGIRERILRLDDVPPVGRIWWQGPPTGGER